MKNQFLINKDSITSLHSKYLIWFHSNLLSNPFPSLFFSILFLHLDRLHKTSLKIQTIIKLFNKIPCQEYTMRRQ